ncbi:MAG: serine/threonine-protein kinase [Verrucomicrobiales bacterium]
MPSDSEFPDVMVDGRIDFDPLSIEELSAALPQFSFSHLFKLDRTGALYRATQTSLDRDSAVKVLPPVTQETSDSFLEDFRHEAQTMAKLNHPNIVKVYDFGEIESKKCPYFAMEYVEGAILGSLIRKGQLTVDHVLSWAPQICTALDYAHQRSVVHCDLRSANILLNRYGVVKVANFSLSQLGGQGPQTTSASGSTFAAIDYFAPEVRESRGSEATPQSDIYSMGVVLYEMLTGHVPRGAWRSVSTVTGADRRFDEIINRAMATAPSERFQSAIEISNRLWEIAFSRA